MIPGEHASFLETHGHSVRLEGLLIGDHFDLHRQGDTFRVNIKTNVTQMYQPSPTYDRGVFICTTASLVGLCVMRPTRNCNEIPTV